MRGPVRPAGPPPAIRVHHDRGGGRLGVDPERLGEGMHELAEGRLQLRGGRSRRAGDQEQCPGLGFGQAREIGAGAADEGPASAPALL